MLTSMELRAGDFLGAGIENPRVPRTNILHALAFRLDEEKSPKGKSISDFITSCFITETTCALSIFKTIVSERKLEEYSEDIMHGIQSWIKNSNEFNAYAKNIRAIAHPAQGVEIAEFYSDALVNYGVNYINRWQMYHNLFRG